MKKLIAIVVVAVVLFSGYGVVGSSFTENRSKQQIDTASFSSVQLNEENDYTSVDLSEATSYLGAVGGYQVPVVTQVFMFPFLTKITDVYVSYSDIQETRLAKPLKRAPQPIADTTEQFTQPVVDLSSQQLYPEQTYTYHVAAGRNSERLVTYVAVHLYPVQYLVSEQSIRCAKNAVITITYQAQEEETPLSTDQYDLLIIAPEKFSSALQSLVDHKINSGVPTKLVTREEICDSVYFPAEGRDCAEEMKYFIKNAFDDWGISYVLLVGGRKGGISEETWWLPVRYSLLNDGAEGSYLTDLYFADLYDAEGNFSDWDSNGNGIFAEWTSTKRDILDMYPEVYVGRLPCTSIAQVKTAVKKIITYETTAYGSEWFKRFIGVAGDTYPGQTDPYFEGELATNASFNQIQDLGFEATMVWASTGQFTNSASVIVPYNEGSGFVHFSGHGNPNVWGNHPPQNDTFLYGPNSFEMRKLSNGDQQPIVIVGGCHNAQYNTSLMNMVRGVLQDRLQYFAWRMSVGDFWYMEWIPQCWAWSMASRGKGGAIAIIANTGLGYGEPGEDTLTQRGRHLEWLFFKAYKDGAVHLGQTHATDLVYYMNEHPPMDDKVDCKIVQEWALLGDPSLMIGGYSS